MSTPTPSPQALHMMKLMREFAEAPHTTLATEIAAFMDKPGELPTLIAACFRSMAARLATEPGKAELDARYEDGRSNGVADTLDACRTQLLDRAIFTTTWVDGVLVDIRRDVS
jgi:hypothetical protein